MILSNVTFIWFIKNMHLLNSFFKKKVVLIHILLFLTYILLALQLFYLKYLSTDSTTHISNCKHPLCAAPQMLPKWLTGKILSRSLPSRGGKTTTRASPTPTPG